MYEASPEKVENTMNWWQIRTKYFYPPSDCLLVYILATD